MRRPLLALALVGTALAAVTQQGSTASNDVPSQTTAVYRSTTVHGATLLSMSYSVTDGSIHAVTPELRGVGLLPGVGGLLPKVVTAHFDAQAPAPCTVTASALLDALTRLAEATYTCGPFLEDADRPQPLTITVS